MGLIGDYFTKPFLYRLLPQISPPYDISVEYECFAFIFGCGIANIILIMGCFYLLNGLIVKHLIETTQSQDIVRVSTPKRKSIPFIYIRWILILIKRVNLHYFQ